MRTKQLTTRPQLVAPADTASAAGVADETGALKGNGGSLIDTPGANLSAAPSLTDAGPPTTTLSPREAGAPQLSPQEAGAPQLSPQEAGAPQLSQQEAGAPQLSQQEAGAPQLSQQEAGAPQLGPFSAPVLLPLSDPEQDDEDPQLSADRLEFYFSSMRPGGLGDYDIWRATRTSVDDQFGDPEPVSELNSTSKDACGSLSADGLTIWLARDAGDLYVATRTGLSSPWTAPTKLPLLTPNDGFENAPWVTADGLLLFFSDNEFESQSLFVSKRTSVSDPWNPAVALDSLNAPEIEQWDPASHDGLKIYFSSEGNLYSAVRSARNLPFGKAQPLPALNSEGNEGDPWISGDGKLLLFASSRAGKKSLYQATR